MTADVVTHYPSKCVISGAAFYATMSAGFTHGLNEKQEIVELILSKKCITYRFIIIDNSPYNFNVWLRKRMTEKHF